MASIIKQKYFSHCFLMSMREDHHRIYACVNGHACKFSIKCDKCGLKQTHMVPLLATLMNDWQHFKCCNH